MQESILTSIKKLLGLMEDDHSFDQDIIIDINSVFMILSQLGVGPDGGFRITGADETWDSYISGEANLDLVKTYMFQKVRLMFDTSTLTSPMIEVINKQIDEFEWRLNVAVDPGPSES